MNNTIVHFCPDLFRDRPLSTRSFTRNFSHIGHRKRLYFGVDLDTVNQVLTLSQTLCWRIDTDWSWLQFTKSCDRAQIMHKRIILFATFSPYRNSSEGKVWMGIRMTVSRSRLKQLFPMLDVAETPVIDRVDISEQIWTKMNSWLTVSLFDKLRFWKWTTNPEIRHVGGRS